MTQSLVSKKKIAFRFLKFVVFVSCVTGFSYQASDFFSHYYSYPTVIEINVRQPKNFTAPAITLCYNSQFKKSKYCDQYPNECEKIYCARRPHYCRNNAAKHQILIPKQKSLEYSNYVNNRNNTAELCQDKSPFKSGIRVEKTFIQTRESYDRDRFLTYPCFTQNMHVLSNRTPEVITIDREERTTISLYRLQIDAHQDEMFDPNTEPGIYFAIHSPYDPVNPYLQGVFFKPGYSYIIYINLEEEKLLKKPYKTDCKDYFAEWEANNREGPRSKEMCIYLCQQNYSMECRQCEWGLPMYNSPDTTCEKPSGCNAKIDHTRKSTLYKNRMKCMERCKSECLKLSYKFSVKERKNIPYVDDYNKKGYIEVQILIENPKVVKLSHRARYMTVESFSTVGGFMGCWLGISIWAFAHNFGSVCSSAVAKGRKCKGLIKIGKRAKQSEDV